MKIHRIGTNGFGGLRGNFRFDPDRVSVVVDDNERGKTTLLAAVAAGLYGLPEDRRTHRVLTPNERWRPWDGMAYDLELEIEADSERYVINRDFARGTVEVRNGAGRDVTAEFRDGKDSYLVGLRLLGLDAEEFQKCALVRQGDLGDVVPGDEKERRASGLRGRLETAADSRVGDTSATAAIGVLEQALRRYNCAELEFTGTADNALQRLASKQALLETEIKALEHDFSQIGAPLEALADLVEEERQVREAMGGIEAARRVSLVVEAKRQLEENRKHRVELEELQQEASRLITSAQIPADAESQLREAVAKLESARSKRADLERVKRQEMAHTRTKLEGEMQGLKVFEPGTVADADQCVALAAELRKVGDEDARLGDHIFDLREALASGGHDRDRLQWLSNRLAPLTESHQALLRMQSELALAQQTEVAGLENQRTVNSETLREIDAQRTRWSLPGWFLLALGFSGIVAGVVVVALQGLPVLSTTFFIAGAVLLAIGIALALIGRQMRDDEREESLRMLSDAQRRLGQLRQQRAETEASLEGVSHDMGYRDHIELLKEWNELGRLKGESSPLQQAQTQLATLETRRHQATEQSRALLLRFGDLPLTPENLETVAARIRRAEAVRQQLAALDQDRPWMDEQKRVDEAAAEGFRERALRILQSAGLTYDPNRSWDEHCRDLAERSKGKQRHATLVEDLIPRAEQRLLAAAQIEELEGRLALVEGEQPAEPERGAREIEEASSRLQAQLDAIQTRRTDLRVRFEEMSRRYHTEHPEKQIQLERIVKSFERARRFRDAVQLAAATIQSVATETHRRWADYLNQRVTDLLVGVGTRIEQIRFGDDLDFSIKVAGRPLLARGKADQQLSCAARDQLYLAVRLAICEFLSRGRSPLPLLLDDVFATSDDERARGGMRMLLERFSDHQVILTTCHRQRYERLKELDSKLYGDRVQWLDTRSAVTR